MSETRRAAILSTLSSAVLFGCSPAGLLNGASRIAGDNARLAASAVSFGDDPRLKLDVWVPSRRSARLLPVVVLLLRRRLGGGRPRRLWLRRTRLRGARFRHRDRGLSAGADGAVSNLRRRRRARPPLGARSCRHMYGGDPRRINLSGHSAGSYIAAMLALDRHFLADQQVDPAIVRAAALLSGPYDFYPFTEQRGRDALGQWPRPRETQPISFVRRDAPPMLLMHGTADTIVRRAIRNGWRRRSRPSARPPSSSSIGAKAISKEKSLISAVSRNHQRARRQRRLFQRPRRARAGGMKRVRSGSGPMLLDRRTFAASSAALLSGCATVGGPRTFAGCTPLPPVNVDESRVIRTMAGLRPYRGSGFVVRAEALGDKRLVHNYGHGGAGITLSWGSSRLATELGLQGHSGPVAVIGAGVMGLSTARLVQEAGFPVTLYAEACRPTRPRTSPAASSTRSAITTRQRSRPNGGRSSPRALDYSWRRFQIMVGDDYGIRWLPTYVETATAPEGKLLADLPAEQPPAAPGRASVPGRQHARYDTMYVETGRYLRQMIRDVQIAGGRIEIRDFATPADIAALARAARLQLHRPRQPRACSATRSCSPARGQLAILVPQPEIRYAFTGEAGYMFPRADGIIARRHVRARPMGRDARARDDRPHPRLAPAPVRRLPLHRLNRLGRVPNLDGDMNYQTSIPETTGPSSGSNAESSRQDERLPHAQGDRRRARRAHHRPGRRQARGRGRAAQPLAPPAARPSCATR